MQQVFFQPDDGQKGKDTHTHIDDIEDYQALLAIILFQVIQFDIYLVAAALMCTLLWSSTSLVYPGNAYFVFNWRLLVITIIFG